MIEEGGFSVKVEVDPGLPAIDVDRDAMIEVLINLISNAIKYSPEEKRIAIAARMENGRVAISVTDRGIGIAKNEQNLALKRRAISALSRSSDPSIRAALQDIVER
jgi:signal transduction histidine kinase